MTSSYSQQVEDTIQSLWKVSERVSIISLEDIECNHVTKLSKHFCLPEDVTQSFHANRLQQCKVGGVLLSCEHTKLQVLSMEQ